MSSVHHRCPFWTQLREAKPHDPKTQSTDPAQPCSPAMPSRYTAQPNSSPAGSDDYSDSSCSSPAQPGSSSDMPDSDWASRTSSLPTNWNPAESCHPALWSPSAALPTRRQVSCSCLNSTGVRSLKQWVFQWPEGADFKDKYKIVQIQIFFLSCR